MHHTSPKSPSDRGTFFFLRISCDPFLVLRSQGLVVVDLHITGLLQGRQKIVCKLTAARHSLAKAKKAVLSGKIKHLSLYKRGCPQQSKSRCRVGGSAEREMERQNGADKHHDYQQQVKGTVARTGSLG